MASLWATGLNIMFSGRDCLAKRASHDNSERGDVRFIAFLYPSHCIGAFQVDKFISTDPG